MRHARRIARLERAVEARTPPATCPSCGGPKPGYNALVLVDDDSPSPARCPDCGLLVDDAGRARSAHRAPHDRAVAIKHIILGSAS